MYTYASRAVQVNMKPSRLSIDSFEPFELFEFKIRSSPCDIIQYTPPPSIIIMVQPYTDNLHKPAPNETEIKKKLKTTADRQRR